MSTRDRAIEWEHDEFHLACSKLDAAPDGVQVIRLDDWRRQDETFDRETRRMVQRVREQQERDVKRNG